MNIVSNMQEMKFGILFILLTLLLGFGLGIAFGGFEEQIEHRLEAKAEAVLDTVYQGDKAKMEKTVQKAWNAIKRAHYHGNGIATSAGVVVILMALVEIPALQRKLAALALGLGSFLYAIFWLLVGCMAPGLGGTGAARKALTLVGAPSAALLVLGLLFASFVIARGLLTKKS